MVNIFPRSTPDYIHSSLAAGRRHAEAVPASATDDLYKSSQRSQQDGATEGGVRPTETDHPSYQGGPALH